MGLGVRFAQWLRGGLGVRLGAREDRQRQAGSWLELLADEPMWENKVAETLASYPISLGPHWPRAN